MTDIRPGIRPPVIFALQFLPRDATQSAVMHE